MTLTNLATVYGPNLLHPGTAEPAYLSMMAMDVVTPVSVVLYYLNCPEEFFDDIPNPSPENTANLRGGGSGGMNSGELVEADTGEAQHRESGSPVAVLRDRSGDVDTSSSQMALRRNRRSSARGATKNTSGGNIRTAASFKTTSSSSSVGSVTPSRESII